MSPKARTRQRWRRRCIARGRGWKKAYTGPLLNHPGLVQALAARLRTGAALLWRVASNIKLPRQQVLPDGSYLSTIYDSTDSARKHGQTRARHRVRVGRLGHTDAGPLSTADNLLDASQALAEEMARLLAPQPGLVCPLFRCSDEDACHVLFMALGLSSTASRLVCSRPVDVPG